MSVGLSPSELALLAKVQNALGEQAYISGHHLRLALLAQGLDKKIIGFGLGALVEKQQLERVKITDPDGQFYLAYRLKSQP